jgi:hypothetical protein
MPSFALLDLVVGMVFIFLLLSLVCLAINETIATIVDMRAQTLKTGVRSLLLGPFRGWNDTRLADDLFRHPLIQSLRERRTIPYWNPKQPSYIPARTFTLALIDLVRNKDLAVLATTDFSALSTAVKSAPSINEDLRRQLTLLLEESQGDIDKAKASIDRWFSDSMERLSAVYKQRIQLIGILVALIVACAFDASAIRMARALADDGVLRAALAEQAVAFSRNPPAQLDGSLVPTPRPAASATAAAGAMNAPVPADSIAARFARADTILGLSRDLLGKATSAGLPIGMPDSVLKAGDWKRAVGRQLWRDFPGLLITVFAISLGAPFWFDILNKVVNLRGAGRAPEEKPKSPEALPRARA